MNRGRAVGVHGLVEARARGDDGLTEPSRTMLDLDDGYSCPCGSYWRPSNLEAVNTHLAISVAVSGLQRNKYHSCIVCLCRIQ